MDSTMTPEQQATVRAGELVRDIRPLLDKLLPLSAELRQLHEKHPRAVEQPLPIEVFCRVWMDWLDQTPTYR